MKSKSVAKKEKIKNCPKCKSNNVSLYRLSHIKEGMGKCLDCEFFVPMKAYTWKKITRLWNEAR